ncbi:MAG: hypothetical protein GY909_14190 [Oligoflexia bacterium]|nr:hypothetical protein [Oligoflexia bacterium]
MHLDVKEHIEKLLNIYTKDDYYDFLVKAKEFYFEKTGKVTEDDDDYELRMNAFTDWYLFQYIPEDRKEPFAQTYAFDNNLVGDFERAFKDLNHSVFEFCGNSLTGKPVLKDILHNTKVTLPKNHPKISLVKGDLFIGRAFPYKLENYLHTGMCILPKEVKSIINKEAKIVRKLKDPTEETEFLFFTESLKTKWSRYGHVDINRIFVYPERKK